MYFEGSSKIVIRKGCFFSNNNATAGGAIYITANTTLDIIGSGPLTSTNAVAFEGNTASFGGAIRVESFASLTTNYVSFTSSKGLVSF